MPDTTRSPTGPESAAERTGTAFPGIGFDLRRFGAEVATELGVDPNTSGAFGLPPEQVRAYETATHSNKRRGGSR